MPNWILFYFLFMYTLIFSSIFILVITCVEIKRGNDWNAIYQKLKNVRYAKWNSEEVMLVKNFWFNECKNRLNQRSLHLLWELPFLIILSFYTFIRTRFHFVQTIVIFRGVFWCFFLGDCRFLVWYSGPMLICTGLLSIPLLPTTLNKNGFYGENGRHKRFKIFCIMRAGSSPARSIKI